MLKVRTFLDKSGIHGLGVFTEEPIKKGAVIAEFVEGIDRRFTPEQVLRLPKDALDYLGHYSYGMNGRIVFPGDNDRFSNHSANPNTKTLPDSSIIALRDIKRGEELTCSYDDFDDTWYKIFPEEKRVTLVA